ncbi:leucine--tRNA ligase [Candidatus Saccharibacteria bacterium]|nr:leucine--tRNA ligase [Candidatus Saccharibacteria bacterium]
MERYEPLKIEEKWQKIWAENETFKALDLPTAKSNGKAKMFLAEMFPYPSGAGLHVGHVRNFTIVDVLTRFYTQQEMNVLRPFGYDTFGLPAENYAIKTGISPQSATKTNIDNFRKQAKRLGLAIDWSREINTSDPEYYRWTQWCFLQLYKKGLAYRKESYQWWCPKDQTVLANEQVEGGKCWRCGEQVEKKLMKQWFFKITDYADELLEDVDALNWPEKIKTMQKNWIGRSEGAEIAFETGDKSILVFTTRPDTIYGATFLVLAPEHPLVKQIVSDDAKAAVEKYCAEAMKKSEIERQENKEKTGVFTGAYAKNPATGEEIPIWVADYVLSGYGTGAIMAVPSDDERDREFAEKFDLPIIEVIKDNQMVNSGEFTGLPNSEMREKILDWLKEKGCGERKVTYKMRDWLISRQRYWGCPIPIAYDKDGEPHPIPEDQLPVLIPEVADYKPDNTGRSALAKAEDWLKVKVLNEKTGKIEEMTRETDTLDGYACSSWYLWRYASPHDNDHAWDADDIAYWAPTDIYVGGDHAVAHLLYIRFWCKFFADQGYLPFREPVKTLLYNGYINAPDGKKMSKSKGNVIDPLDVINQGYGADTLRTYEMFIGPYDQDAAWDTKAIGGVYRFLNRCWSLTFTDAGVTTGTDTGAIRHKTIKKVTTDLHRRCFNTAVASLMEYVNELYKVGASHEDLTVLAKLLKPFAPHLASEMLEKLGEDDVWPTWDEQHFAEDEVEIMVQVNGKIRGKVSVPAESLEDADLIEKAARANANVAKYLEGGVKKVIKPAKAKLINFVV